MLELESYLFAAEIGHLDFLVWEVQFFVLEERFPEVVEEEG